MHTLIAAAVAGIPAGDVDYNFTRSVAGRGVEFKGPVFQFEASVYGMKDVGQCKGNGRATRIELNSVFRRRKGKTTNQEKDKSSFHKWTVTPQEDVGLVGTWIAG